MQVKWPEGRQEQRGKIFTIIKCLFDVHYQVIGQNHSFQLLFPPASVEPGLD